LKYAFTGGGTSDKVTKDSFRTAIHWITDAIYPGWSIVKSIATNVRYNWFYVNASTLDESKFITKRHQFMVRFSQKNDSLVIAFIKSKKKKSNKFSHTLVDNPYILYKRLKKSTRKHSLKPMGYTKQFPQEKEGKIDFDKSLPPIPDHAQIIN